MRWIHLIGRIGFSGSLLGGAALVFIMCITIASVIYRLLGRAIVGSYEITELVVVLTVGFALVYSTITKTNVAVHFFSNRFAPKLKRVNNCFIALLSLTFWGWMAWGTISMAIERGWLERTEVFLFPLLPFRLIWGFALIVLCLAHVTDLITAFSGKETK